MAYFKHLPDILYQSPLSHKNSSGDYISIKNIFRRTKLKDYLAGNVSLFNKYVIEDGERPDTIAENLYGSSQYDFVVVLVFLGCYHFQPGFPFAVFPIFVGTLTVTARAAVVFELVADAFESAAVALELAVVVFELAAVAAELVAVVTEV